MTKDDFYNLTKLIENSNLLLNSDLRNYKNLMFNNLVKIKSYRGIRKLQKLPVRGQRTHTNSKTCKKIKN